MEVLRHLESWAKGDASQGQVMVVIGILLVLSIVLILRQESALLRGMVIPLSLLTLICLGYGSFMAYSRPQYVISTIEEFDKAPEQTAQKQLKKIAQDHKVYSTLIPIWAILIVAAVALYFIFNKDYYKGVALGVMAMSVGGIVIDTLLHHRLEPYLNALQDYIK